jgi:DNA-binding beta-propeller fold protein YncE
VINAKTASVVNTIALGDNPEFAAAFSAADRIYCNVEDKSEVAVIDTAKHEVVARWSLVPGTEPTGMAFDATHHRLFVGCHNKLMAMLGTETGKVVATVPIGAGVDGCAFDDATQLAFASCGDGTTTIAKEETPQKLTTIQTLKTERGARTIALDPQAHRRWQAVQRVCRIVTFLSSGCNNPLLAFIAFTGSKSPQTAENHHHKGEMNAH